MDSPAIILRREDLPLPFVPATNKIFQSTTTSFWDQTASGYFTPLNSTSSATFVYSTTTAENAAVSISTTAAVTGNAAADNTAEVNMLYYLMKI